MKLAEEVKELVENNNWEKYKNKIKTHQTLNSYGWGNAAGDDIYKHKDFPREKIRIDLSGGGTHQDSKRNTKIVFTPEFLSDYLKKLHKKD
jgi:hypothetical protein